MKSTISLWLLTCATLPLMAQKTIEVSVVNPSSQARNDQPVVLQLERYGQDIRSALVTCEGKEIKSWYEVKNLKQVKQALVAGHPVAAAFAWGSGTHGAISGAITATAI